MHPYKVTTNETKIKPIRAYMNAHIHYIRHRNRTVNCSIGFTMTNDNDNDNDK